ncbi:unnamed protein product [Moneuplotes crassus]|uniref:Uncharacterized protein n=1 Tax=Euplotes crassus TaxID=5936 RepID=A0AAD2DAD5_EUPCR|nr:unnamed protein product [Moneuplotes crassus]
MIPPLESSQNEHAQSHDQVTNIVQNQTTLNLPEDMQPNGLFAEKVNEDFENFMNQAGVKPGFLTQTEKNSLPTFKASLEATHEETKQVPGFTANVTSEVNDQNENSMAPKKSHEKLNRWGKKEDKILWRTIKEDIAKGAYTLEYMKNIPLAKARKNSHMVNLSQSIGWKTSCSKLLGRIQKCIADSFSVRDEILLRKLIKKKHYKNLDYDHLLEHFSGKTKERIMQVCHALCQAKEQKKLTSAKII